MASSGWLPVGGVVGDAGRDAGALMDASAEEQAEVVRRLKPDRDLMGRYRNLLALRYRGKEELLERIALMNSFWTDEIMAESWLVQEELRAREEGSA